jgi:hypothetical protein
MDPMYFSLLYLGAGALACVIAALISEPGTDVPYGPLFFFWPFFVVIGGFALVCIAAGDGFTALRNYIDDKKFERRRRS